jgi:sensor c-di-GMP phosphodiesterase-like protein
MIEVPSQVHDLLTQSRAEMAATRRVLGEGVDATRHAAEVVTSEADHLRHAAVQATVKAADVGQHALGSASSQLKATTLRQRVLVQLLLALVVALGIAALIRAKRRREATEDPLEWEPIE